MQEGVLFCVPNQKAATAAAAASAHVRINLSFLMHSEIHQDFKVTLNLLKSPTGFCLKVDSSKILFVFN